MKEETLQQLTEEERAKVREAAAILARIKSPRKVAAAMHAQAQRRPDQMGGRPAKHWRDYPCTCGADDATEGHRTNCPRWAALYRRKRAGRPIEP